MGTFNPLNEDALSRQVKQQRQLAWDLDHDIRWSRGVDTNRYLLPLDDDALLFPGASEEQRLAISQFFGLVINATIAEMESVIHNLRDSGWTSILSRYPVNPEMYQLGELFFEEEYKHSLLFNRYNEAFAQSAGIDLEALDTLLPKAFGSRFLNALIRNTNVGGHAFWWIVSTVEEVSLALFKYIQNYEAGIDPLFYEVHQRHLEEEARHRNYAFLMLDIIGRRPQNMRQRFHRSWDLVVAQTVTSGWVLGELHKFYQVEDLKHQHPFFEVLASCKPLMEKLSWKEIVTRLFKSAPYISHVLNMKYHPQSIKAKKDHSAWSIPLPEPEPLATFVSTRKRGKDHVA